MTLLVSVVTICYNDYEGLWRTYHSVCGQDRSIFEWIIVDGGSRDATRDFLKSLGPDVARWSSEPDQGIYDAMNKGIRRSNGKYCIFLNSGDEFATNDTLCKLRPTLSAFNDIVYGDAIEILGADEAYKKAFPASRFWYSMFTHHQAIFYRRGAISRGYDQSFRLAADWALTSYLLMNGASVIYVREPVCRFHRGGSSDDRKLRSLANRELWRIYREVHGHSLLSSVLLYAIKRVANVVRFSAKPLYQKIRLRAVLATKR